jgi:hypothetical protein
MMAPIDGARVVVDLVELALVSLLVEIAQLRSLCLQLKGDTENARLTTIRIPEEKKQLTLNTPTLNFGARERRKRLRCSRLVLDESPDWRDLVNVPTAPEYAFYHYPRPFLGNSS